MSKRKGKKQCYMCDKLATSKEHVPPACLFPEEKDIKTSVFRNNLITVPSCDQHNSKKSSDDEFLMSCLAGIVGNNVIGFFHAHTKVRRALERKGNDPVHVLMREAQRFNWRDAKGNVFPVLVGRPDFSRLHSCFEHIAYGLYYHHFGKRFEGECKLVMDFLTYESKQAEEYKLLCRKRIEVEPIRPKTGGSNPEIFRFDFFEPDKFGLIALQMTFYEGAKVFVAFKGKGAKEPDDLIALFLKSGLKTFVSFDDGSKFEIN